LKIDFINDGSHDGPFLRLLSDQIDEIKSVRNCFVALGSSEINEITVSDLPISDSKVKVIFKVCKSGFGVIISKDKREFTINLSNVSYSDMADKLNHLLPIQNGFTWLYESKTFYILFTTDGYW
jgi:hypothetical protein